MVYRFVLYFPRQFQKTLNIITDNPQNEKERKMKKNKGTGNREQGTGEVAVNRGLINVEAVIQTVAVLGQGMKISKDLAELAKDAYEDLGIIRRAATGADKNRPKKRWELYKDYHEAWAAHQKDGVCMNVTWAFAGWLYMDVIEGESRLDYLKRCEAVRILKGNGYKELASLEKAAKKIGGAK